MTHRLLLCISTCLSSFLLSQVSLGDDWPHWGGPRRDASWNEAGILESFTEAGPPVVWRAPIRLGYSSPAVADGKVFVMDRSEDRQAKPQVKGSIVGTERCLCLDAKTGETLWAHEYECEYKISYPEGPRTTPSVAGNIVYFLGAMGRLAAHDVSSGKVLWEKELMKEYNVQPPAWGFAVHPFVDGDRLFCVVGGEGSSVVCLDRHSGKEIWKEGTAQEVGYAPLVLHEHDGIRQLIHWFDIGIISMDPATGKKLWEQPFPKRPPSRPVVCISTPSIFQDKLLVSDFYHGSMLLQLEYDPVGSKEIWSSSPEDQQHEKDLNSLMSTLVMQEDAIYGIAGDGEMRCISWEKQKLLWRDLQPSSAERQALFATSFLVKNGDRHFLFNDQGYLKIVHLNAEGYRESSSAQILKPSGFARGREVVWSHPAFAEQHLFARNTEEIVCYDMRKKG